MDGSLFDMQAYVIAMLGLNLAVSVTTLCFALRDWRRRLSASETPKILTPANEFDAAKLRLSGPTPPGSKPPSPKSSSPRQMAKEPVASDEHL